MRRVAKALAAMVLAMSVTACIDAEITVEILSETEAEMTASASIQRALYDMTRGTESDFCADGTVQVGEQEVTCTVTKRGPIEEIVLAENSDSNPFRLIPVGNGRVRYEVMLQALRGAGGQSAGEMSDPMAMNMMKAAMAGRSFVFVVKGSAIEDTNMTLAEDGRSARFVLPLIDIVQGASDMPDAVYAVVNTRRCALMGLICL